MEKGRPMDALPFFVEATKISPLSHEYHFHLGNFLFIFREQILLNKILEKKSLQKLTHQCFEKAASLQSTSFQYRLRFAQSFFDYEESNNTEAIKICSEKACNGRLYEPKNKIENDLVWKWMDLIGANPYDGYDVWLGINDNAREGYWVYNSGGPVNFTNFKIDRDGYQWGQRGTGKNCVAMVDYGEWLDTDCNYGGSQYLFVKYHFPTNLKSIKKSQAPIILK